jgi:hypothetical protein
MKPLILNHNVDWVTQREAEECICDEELEVCGSVLDDEYEGDNEDES